ncbi:MAG: DUF2231 domain-containing protein [Nocardioides sp.]
MDTIAGLPLHPLIVHAAVVLGPLTALLFVLYAVVPRWRGALKWPIVIGAVVSAISGALSAASGEGLEHLVSSGGEANRSLVEAHAEAGELAAASLYGLAVVVIVVIFLLLPPLDRGRKALGTLGLVAALLASIFVGYAVFNAGHTGAKSSWSEVVSDSSNHGTPDSDNG